MKTYLFDFDGTLVDSMPAYVGAMLRILDENGVEYGDDIVKIITPLGTVGTAKYFIQLGVKLSMDEIIGRKREYLAYEYFYKIQPKENVIFTLKQLKASGASLNVLTASPHITLDTCLKRLGIFDLFDNVWSCDDFNTSKTDPEIYKKAAESIGEKVENVLFVDDNLNANKTAKKAGMVVCGIFDESSAEYVDEMKAATDFYIYDFIELLSLKF